MNELDKLEEYLKEHNIPYEREDHEFDLNFNRHQIMIPGFGRPYEYEWDAICHRGSYGYEQGLLEIYGNLVDVETDGDSVVGWLTAQDVIDRIERKKNDQEGKSGDRPDAYCNDPDGMH